MIYLKEPNTNRIVEFQNEDSIGISFEGWEKATQEEIDQYKLNNSKQRRIGRCKNYLCTTEWYIIRMADPSNATVIPENVLINRANARAWQDEINACTTLEELNAININFN